MQKELKDISHKLTIESLHYNCYTEITVNTVYGKNMNLRGKH